MNNSKDKKKNEEEENNISENTNIKKCYPFVLRYLEIVTNKVGDYAMSGLPVVNTQENREYRQLVEKYKCGINCECENVDDIANAIIKLSSDLDLRIKMGINSLTLDKEKFDRDNTYNEIVNAIKSML